MVVQARAQAERVLVAQESVAPGLAVPVEPETRAVANEDSLAKSTKNSKNQERKRSRPTHRTLRHDPYDFYRRRSQLRHQRGLHSRLTTGESRPRLLRGEV